MIIKVTESSGHTACPGRTGGLGTELDVQVTDGDMGHCILVHLLSLVQIACIGNVQDFLYSVISASSPIGESPPNATYENDIAFYHRSTFDRDMVKIV